MIEIYKDTHSLLCKIKTVAGYKTLPFVVKNIATCDRLGSPCILCDRSFISLEGDNNYTCMTTSITRIERLYNESDITKIIEYVI